MQQQSSTEQSTQAAQTAQTAQAAQSSPDPVDIARLSRSDDAQGLLNRLDALEKHSRWPLMHFASYIVAIFIGLTMSERLASRPSMMAVLVLVGLAGMIGNMVESKMQHAKIRLLINYLRSTDHQRRS